MKINTLALAAIFSAFALTGCRNNEYSWENDLQHRLETDFCRERSEVEWSGGNLYFTDWDYDMDIQYF